MPLANPEESFEVAARHLFRHLGEPNRLRRNPLVRRFFEDAGGRMTRTGAKAALALIVRVIEEAAERVRSHDIAARENERAYRQHTIFRRTYIERAPIPQIAADLGLSVRQYYRERAAICARIARYIQSVDARTPAITPYARLDPLRFRMEQAIQRAETGDAAAAARIFADLAQTCEAAGVRIEALCRLADVEAEQGADDAATARLREARALLASDGFELPAVAREAMRCHLALVEARAAWHAGRGPHAVDALGEAQRLTETLLARGGKRVRELAVEVILDCAQRSADRGEFGAALDGLRRARELQASLPDPSLRQRSDVVRLRALLEMTAPHPLAMPEESFAPLSDALDAARACGSAKRAILATAALCVQYAYARKERGVVDAARRTIAMLEHVAGTRFQGQVALIVADALVTTRYWKRGLRIIDLAQSALASGSFEWVKLKTVQAEYHRRSGRILESHVAAAASERYARAFGSRRLQGAAYRTMALSSHALGNSRDARVYVAEALSAVDQHGSALSRSYTLCVAKMIA